MSFMEMFIIPLEMQMEQVGTLISLVVTLTSFLAAAIVFVYQWLKHMTERFVAYADNLKSDNEVSQITSAILLRSFLRNFLYRRDALNVIISLLRVLERGHLQKTLGDGLSSLLKAKGQDFQKIKLYDVLIKPDSHIQFELTEDVKYKNKRINLVGADFYCSRIEASSINSCNFANAVFFMSVLNGTSFRNCIFRKANFKAADLTGVKFYDCDLTDADFTDAKGLESASIVEYKIEMANGVSEMPIRSATSLSKGCSKKKIALSVYIDADGKFRGDNPKEGQKKVFVSKLGSMDDNQKQQYDKVLEFLTHTYQVEIVAIDRGEYPDNGQLAMIRNKMKSCSGVLVFAFSYMKVSEASVHNIADKWQAISNCAYSSPWLQVETAYADSFRLPTLIIYENGVVCDGIFDDKMASSSMIKIPYSEALEENENIKKWYNLTDEYMLKQYNEYVS